MFEQKLVRVENNDMEELNSLLEDGWIIKSMSACGTGADGGSRPRYGSSYCYVWLERRAHEGN
jgi:hypothetical protein